MLASFDQQYLNSVLNQYLRCGAPGIFIVGPQLFM